MELLNFKIGDDYISVEKDSLYFDLHSNFNFTGFNYNAPNKEFQLTFVKSLEEWAANEVINNLIFTFRGVSFLKIREKDNLLNIQDVDCLNDIGFGAFDSRQDMDSFLATNQFQYNYDLIFIFISGQSIKVHSDTVFLETNCNEKTNL